MNRILYAQFFKVTNQKSMKVTATQILLNLHFFRAGKFQKNFALDLPLYPSEETKL